MLFPLILLACILNMFQIIECKKYRVHTDDRISPYPDKTVPLYTDYFALDNFIFEQIDDENVQIGGHLEAIKSMDRSMPLVMNIRTKFYEKATWNDGTYQLTIPNVCIEFNNPQRVWYNITKLWTFGVCPTLKGDILNIETNIVNIITDVPPNMPIVPWKVLVLATQGLLGYEKVKFGFAFQVEFLPIN